MYGLLAKLRTHGGQRETVIGHLLSSSDSLPGCLSYVVAKDSADADVIWITEVWNDQASHDASLSLPAAQAAIAQARPLIADVESTTAVEPVGGIGLPAR
jgi:quinol monooxygenase YgiN